MLMSTSHIRRWYFLRNLRHIVSAEMERDHTVQTPQNISPSLRHIRETLARLQEKQRNNGGAPSISPSTSRSSSQRRGAKLPLRADMIRRLDIAPHPIGPMGAHAPRVTSDRPAEASGIDVMSSAASRRSFRTSTIPPPPAQPASEEDDFGGFPGIQDLLALIARKTPLSLQRRLKRTLTVPRTETLVPQAASGITEEGDAPVKRVPYLSFSATVKRNSSFYGLTAENIEELGGVEYRALCSLSWIIPAVSAGHEYRSHTSRLICDGVQYYIGLLSISFIVTAPYMSMERWQENYHVPLQHREINSVWYVDLK